MPESHHRLLQADARKPLELPGPVHLLLTSPPYPMVAMWDELWRSLDPRAGQLLDEGRAWEAWEAQHAALDRVWATHVEALVPGGIVAINIGDAVRTVGERFALYPNHARISDSLRRLGLHPLPDILWRKPTNAPNKFMGSGMLPGGAYVTYEHEYILLFRKGDRRSFNAAEARRRRQSAYFWEERNLWFSDLWVDLRGAAQEPGGGRERSAAFPLELAWRLIHMYSLQGDVILDPFGGTGTTSLAALISGRSSISLELDGGLVDEAERRLLGSVGLGAERGRRRLEAHLRHVEERSAAGKALGHYNPGLGCAVMTSQEEEMMPLIPTRVERLGPGKLRAELAELAEIPSPEPQAAPSGQLILPLAPKGD